MAVKILIEEILEKRRIEGKENSMYWLAKEIGVTYPTILNIVKGNPTSIKLELLEKLCKVLECKLTDIIKFADKEKTAE